jgi:site-specific recombinase XerD
MFEQIFNKPEVVALHRNAPWREEREKFLQHLANQGYARGSLAAYSRRLLSVAVALGAEREVTEDEIALSAKVQGSRAQSFQRVARLWYGFLGLLREAEQQAPGPFAEIVEDLSAWLTNERGLAARTVEHYLWHARKFLDWYATEGHPLEELRIEDIDRHLVDCGKKGFSRGTLASRATAVRTLLARASTRGWCSPLIAGAIERPRIYELEGLPIGPSWQDVSAMLASASSNSMQDVRDRAILMLFAIYGLRAREVAELRLDDIDWDTERILVRRPKRRSAQSYPLTTIVGNAILRYVREYRQSSSRREVFLTLTAPIRPVSRGTLYSLVRDRMDALAVPSRRRGPHALRHACATHLVEQGLTLKEIGDHLGHQSSSSTRVYAKVNLQALRAVAEFDLGGVL